MSMLSLYYCILDLVKGIKEPSNKNKCRLLVPHPLLNVNVIYISILSYFRPRKGRKGTIKYEQMTIVSTPPLAPESGMVKWNHIFQVRKQ